MNRVIYSTSVCPRCALLKAACRQADIPYEEASLPDMPGTDRTNCIVELGAVPISAPVVRNGDIWIAPEDLFDGERLRADWQGRLTC